MTSKSNERPVLVTTVHHGVFFGYATTETNGTTIDLRRARNAIYWTADLRGFMGLASIGPSKACKIGPAADIQLRDITAIVEVTPEAAEKWEKAPWAS